MTVSALCIVGAALCAICSTIASILITADLDKRGIKTSLPLMRWYFFRHLDLYRQETLKANGKVGPLFLCVVIPINAAWILAILAFATR